MITITLGELKTIETALSKLLTMQLPIKLSFRLSKILKPINDELARVEEFRVAKIMELGVPNEDNSSVTIPTEKLEQFKQEIGELYSEEITLPFEPVQIDDLPENLTLSAVEIAALEKIIV